MGRASGKSLSVAIAVIERCGRILVCRRPADVDHAGCWEFPGGKRERGESWRACLQREVREELGVAVRTMAELDRFQYRYPQYRVSFRVFRCAITNGIPRPLAARSLRWVLRGRLSRLQFPPANDRLVRWLAGGVGRPERPSDGKLPRAPSRGIIPADRPQKRRAR